MADHLSGPRAPLSATAEQFHQAMPTSGARGLAGSHRELIAVDVNALRQVVLALVGPAHQVRELQATRSLQLLGHPNPIDTLCEQLEAWRPSAGGAVQMSDSERAELLGWASACQSAYHIESTPGHRFGAMASNLQDNRAGLVGYVDALLVNRASRAAVASACRGASAGGEAA